MKFSKDSVLAMAILALLLGAWVLLGHIYLAICSLVLSVYLGIKFGKVMQTDLTEEEIEQLKGSNSNHWG